MATLVTPSAKSHERVTGRWLRDMQAQTRREWTVYYIKLIVGSPIPILLGLFVLALFMSRYALEVTAWGTALLTSFYICADRFTQHREFKFFSIGSDLFLFFYLAINLLSLFSMTSQNSYFDGLGSLRWIPLVYLFSYCWELFPGLNRIFAALFVSASVVVAYAIWQHFTGIEWIHSDIKLEAAPTVQNAFFCVTGFFRTPEILATMLAMLLPFPASIFLLSEPRDQKLLRWGSFFLFLFLALGVFWTYRPGLWIAACSGVVITTLLQGKKPWLFLLLFLGFFAFLIPLTYDNPEVFLSRLGDAELARAEKQRVEINANLKLFDQNNWLGSGVSGEPSKSFDTTSGNVYFQILAETGILGLTFYLLFILGFLLANFRILQEIPATHFWHRILMAGGMASQVAFHAAGLYWSTLREAFSLYLFVFILAALGYAAEHYSRGLVPDDQSL